MSTHFTVVTTLKLVWTPTIVVYMTKQIQSKNCLRNHKNQLRENMSPWVDELGDHGQILNMPPEWIYPIVY